MHRLFTLLLLSFVSPSLAQAPLPPIQKWSGKSESLIVKPSHPWITPTEQSGFETTPSYAETMAWLTKLDQASPLITLVTIGKSVEGRDIVMVIASTDKSVSATSLKNSKKPLMLVQAGIHAGEIDGKDAGMMLLRDIAFGTKKQLINNVNLLFIPILNVDGHERTSLHNRPNQRGPANMGYRTNAQNLNLNRDFAKLDTREVQAVVEVINTYDPLLYLDLHVTDGADYQYDITFGGMGAQGYSPAITQWLETTYRPAVTADLQGQGHIPGQLLFALNDRDFSEGNILVQGGPRFSDAYGDLRHLGAVLVENHSLKPFKQRVLGTYVLLESTLQVLADQGSALRESTQTDRITRNAQIPLVWKVPQMENAVSFESNGEPNTLTNAAPPDSLDLLAITSRLVKSEITGSDYIEWLGAPITQKIANYKAIKPDGWVNRPKAYWVPAANETVIKRLQLHGVEMERITKPTEVEVEMYRIENAKFQNESGRVAPFEGHMQVTGTTKAEKRKQVYAPGSVRITTDQPLEELIVILLETSSADSFFRWGFFAEIFQRTEYIEAYVMEPLMKQMLAESEALRIEFEEKKANDPAFAGNPAAIFTWFYSKTPYYDERYLLYPVGREL